MSEAPKQYGVTGGGPVMAIFAHADDPEFVAGGALALWAEAGRQLIYVICTDGSKGSSDPTVTGDALIARRREEQRAAARHLGCDEVVFLPYEDAVLEPTIALRRDLVRQIRKYKPQIVVCFDPSDFWIGEFFLQHPDHRASGEAALAAIYPAARDRLTFPELLAEGLEPHAVDDIYMSTAGEPNRWIDIESVLDRKVEALLKHESQMGDGIWASKALRSFAHRAGESQGLRYAESFRFVSFATPRGWFDDEE